MASPLRLAFFFMSQAFALNCTGLASEFSLSQIVPCTAHKLHLKFSREGRLRMVRSGVLALVQVRFFGGGVGGGESWKGLFWGEPGVKSLHVFDLGQLTLNCLVQ